MRTSAITTIAAAALAIALTGCTAPTSAETATPTAQATSLRVTDAWVKAAGSGMSAAFGTLENTGASPVTVTAASSTAATSVQLHETVENAAGATVMQEKKGGFTIPAHGRLELAPGGNHLMLMGLTAPIAAGDEVTFTLTMTDGSTRDVTAPAKDFSGANENYDGGSTPTPTDGGMDMGH